MSCNDHFRVLEALNVLCNVSKEALRSHRAEVLLAVQKLQALVGGPSALQVTNGSSLSVEAQCSPTPSSDCHNPYPNAPNIIDTSLCPVNAQASTTSSIHQSSSPPSIHQSSSPPYADGDEASPPKSISSLSQALDNDSSQIKDFLSKSEFEATGDDLKRLVEDPRVVDLQLDKSRLSPKARFRKGLSQRSLAIEYCQWEHCTYKSSRVDELAEDLSISQERGPGHIEQYLKRNDYRFKNQQVTRSGIEHGIKMLVFERLLGKRAISAILSFKYRRFRAVKFEELGFLVTMVNQKKWVVELVEQKADWLDGCQNQYDAWCKGVSRRESLGERVPEPCSKRRRLNQAVAFHQLGSPFENQLLWCQDNSQSGNQISPTTWGRANSGGDREHPQTQTDDNLLSSPTQWEGEATENSGSATDIPSAATHQATTALNIQNNAQNMFMHSDISGSDDTDNTIPGQWMVGCEPPISSTVHYDLAKLAQANLPSLPRENAAYQFDLAGLAQANLPPLPRENSAYQFDLATLSQANLPPLPPDTTRFGFDAPEHTPGHFFAALPQPPSINV